MRHFKSGRRTARRSRAPHRSIENKCSLIALSKVLIGVLVTALLCGCGESPEEARFKLSELGYEYNLGALFVAINDRDPVAVALLMRAGMDPDTRLPYRGLMQLGHDMNNTPEFLQMLQSSVQEPWAPEILEWLNRLGARTLKDYRATPLIVASVMGHTQTIEALLRAGADANLPDSEALTPLVWAVMGDRIESATTLLDNGAEIVLEKRGAMVVETAVGSGNRTGNSAMLELVLDAGGKALVRDNPVVAALYAASRAGNVELIEMLLDAGATADAKDGTGDTALIGAVNSGSIEAVEALLDEDADPNLQNAQGVTPLIAAGTSGEIALFEALLDAGADPSAQSDQGETALIGAVKRHDMDKVRLLIDAGVDLDLRDASGNTALQLVVARGKRENGRRADGEDRHLD